MERVGGIRASGVASVVSNVRFFFFYFAFSLAEARLGFKKRP